MSRTRDELLSRPEPNGVLRCGPETRPTSLIPRPLWTPRPGRGRYDAAAHLLQPVPGIAIVSRVIVRRVIVGRVIVSRVIFSNPYQLREAYERANVPKHAYAKGPSVMDIRALAAHMADEQAERGLVLAPHVTVPASWGWLSWHSRPEPSERLRH